LCLGVPVQRILATTFTRKAAGEILDRVLARLAHAARSPEAARTLGEFIGDPHLDSLRCRLMLASFARSLHKVRIGTIDSFFARIASAFEFDLGLPLGWKIAEDEDQHALTLEAAESTLERATTDELVELLRRLHLGGFPSQITPALLRIVTSAQALARRTSRTEWDVPTPPANPPELTPASYEEALHRLAKMPAIPTGAAKPNGHLARARDRFVQAALSAQYVELAASTLARAASTDGLYHNATIPTEMADLVAQIARHASRCALAEFREGNLAMHTLASRFNEALSDLKTARGIFAFEDVPRVLLAANVAGDLDDLFFRLDSRIDHVLLDEFQDTSIEQFSLLRPLLEEILSGGEGTSDRTGATSRAGRSVFLVGDIKQSMYGWRDAEPGLFPEVLRLWPHLRRVDLHQSRRSSQVVLDLVNTVFTDLTTNAAFPSGSDLDTARSWSSSFIPHTTAKNIPGCVRVHISKECAADESQVLARLRFAADRIRAISQGAPKATIGVLLPARRHIARLIYELQLRDIPASEEGGNPLTDSPAVAATLSALQIVDHPSDRAARFHVATTPLADHLDLRAWRSDERATEFSARSRYHIAQHGLASTLRDWRAALKHQVVARDLDRMGQLVDLAHQFEPKMGPRLRPFIEMIHSTRVESAASERVRVMTIHKSKGLEFDAVVLPDLDVAMLRNDGLVTRRRGVLEPIQAVSRFPSQDVRSICPELEEMHAQTRARDLRDRLCVLYVALTRARHAVEIVVDPKSTASPPHYAQVVRNALAIASDAAPGQVAHEVGDDSWMSHFLEVDRPPANPASITIRLQTHREIPTSRLPLVAPSLLHAPQRDEAVPSTSLRSPALHDASQLGTQVHAALEQLDWLDELAIPPRSLADHASALDPSNRDAVESLLTSALNQPEIRHALSRARYLPWSTDRLLLKKEVRLGIRDSDAAHDADHVLAGFLDRLVIGFHGETPAYAEVLDFKSDDLPESHVADRTNHYAPQINAYRQMVARQFSLSLDHVWGTLVYLRPGRVVSWS
jgi:ATP-dependent exoDNAse (exonuclease V) beta subunit